MEMFETSLIDTMTWGGDVVTYRFEKPDEYRFVPGQFLRLEVETATGKQAKPFTIASAPDDAWLEVTTRLSDSEFKVALSELTPGGAVSVSAPAGRLVLPPDPGKVGFLVGGVGVTPAHSMLRHAVLSGQDLDATLFYGNRDATCMPYAPEFDSMRERGIRTVHVLQYPPAGWLGESGFITSDLVRRHVEPSGMLWISSGPPMMIEAMEKVLAGLEVPADLQRIERFAGYA